MSNDQYSPTLVIFGLDAGDAEYIRHWAQAGYLPTIAAIMEQGCWGHIGGPDLMSTQGAWLSLFSGIPRLEHGYYFNRQLKPGTYEFQDISSSDTGVQPFWSHLGRSSKKVAIVDALEANVQTNLPGIQLVNWAIQKQFNTAVAPISFEPATLLDDGDGIVGAIPPIDGFNPDSSASEDLVDYHRLMDRVEQKGKLCRHLLAQDQYDLAVITFVEAHTAAHRLWDYRTGGMRCSPATSKGSELSTGIRNVYQAIDREIGLLLKQFPKKPYIVLLSLFGIKDLHSTRGLIESFCRQLGYQVPPSGKLNDLTPLALARRIIPPKWRDRLSQFFPLRLQQRLQSQQFLSQTDWGRTTAFPLPGLYSSFIRVNLRGREPKGIVEPGWEYEELLSRLETDLLQLVDPHSGESVVQTVTKTVEAYSCDPPVVLPDLWIEWKASPRFIDRVLHPKCELIQIAPLYNRSSYHSFKGFFATSGPSIASGAYLGEVSVLDLAPTFFSLLGERPVERFVGQLINRMIRGEISQHG
jgi:predicted AlkP superfamily phosphohydrolase/phosphomutase